MQFTITYRKAASGLRFAVITGDSVADAKRQVIERSPGAVILTVRENTTPLAIVTAQESK